MGDVCLPFDILFFCACNAFFFVSEKQVVIEICDKISGGCLGERHFNCRMRGRNFEKVAHV